jgi:hypothetical protein
MASLATNSSSNVSEESKKIGFEVNISKSNPGDPGYSKYRQLLPNDIKDVDDFIEEQSKHESNLMMVTVKGGINKNEDETHIKFYSIMDVSGSMGQMVEYNDELDPEKIMRHSRIKIAKMVQETVLEKLHGGDYAKCVTFSDDAETVIESTEMISANLSKVKKKNNDIQTKNMTNMASAIIPVMEEMKKEEMKKLQSSKSTNIIVLTSDGLNNKGIGGKLLISALKTIGLEDFSFYVIGIGSGTNEDFLKDLATALNGTYFQTDGDPETLGKIVGSIIGGERGVMAKEISCIISTDKGKLVPVFEGPFDVKISEGNNAIHCDLNGSLQEEEEKSIIFSCDTKDANVQVLCKGFDMISNSYSISSESNVKNGELLTTWFNFTFSKLIENLIKKFDSDFDSGKKEALIVQAYLIGIEKKYSSEIEAESIKDMKAEVKKLIDTHDNISYKNSARKEASAMTSSISTMRNPKSGGKRKQDSMEEFSQSVRGKSSRW